MTELEKTIARIIRDFDWGNYSLDEVAAIPAEYTDYASDLAKEIVAAIGEKKQ